jgi:hypothetical protein
VLFGFESKRHGYKNPGIRHYFVFKGVREEAGLEK